MLQPVFSHGQFIKLYREHLPKKIFFMKINNDINQGQILKIQTDYLLKTLFLKKFFKNTLLIYYKITSPILIVNIFSVFIAKII